MTQRLKAFAVKGLRLFVFSVFQKIKKIGKGNQWMFAACQHLSNHWLVGLCHHGNNIERRIQPNEGIHKGGHPFQIGVLHDVRQT